MIDFNEKIAVVTGAAQGIGASIVRAMVGLGANVAIIDTDKTALDQSVEAMGTSLKGQVSTFAGDVRDSAFLQKTAGKIAEKWDGIDVLVNNAGIIRDNFLENVSETDWDDVLDVNLKGAFLACQAIVPTMKARKRGSIVNILSRAWLGNIGQVNYSASKGGLVSLTRTLALELARYNITVNGVAPGLIDTPMTRGLSAKAMDRLLKAQPGGRTGTVDEIAAAVCFLASDHARFITGQILHVDGGKSCGTLSL